MIREEIREGINRLIPYDPLEPNRPPEVVTREILSYLHSQGVVIKVARELPFPGEKMFARLNYQIDPMSPVRGSVIEAYRLAQQDMGEIGYVAVESLIKE